ncbi:MAG: nuclear transport factor 2 family protein [Alphaproteobacteria bacterium]
MKFSIALLFVALAAPAIARAEDPPMSREECAVWNRELSFARSVDSHDPKAFASHVHPGAVFNVASATPVKGRDAVVADWANIIEGKEFQLVWRPQFVSIGGEANIAASRGPFMIHNSGPEGEGRLCGRHLLLRVGAQKHDAPWMVLFDGGGTPEAGRRRGRGARLHGQGPRDLPNEVVASLVSRECWALSAYLRA